MIKLKRKSTGSLVVSTSLEFTKNNILSCSYKSISEGSLEEKKPKQKNQNNKPPKQNKPSIFPNCPIQHHLWCKAKLKENSRGLFIFSEIDSSNREITLQKLLKNWKLPLLSIVTLK